MLTRRERVGNSGLKTMDENSSTNDWQRKDILRNNPSLTGTKANRQKITDPQNSRQPHQHVLQCIDLHCITCARTGQGTLSSCSRANHDVVCNDTQDSLLSSQLQIPHASQYPSLPNRKLASLDDLRANYAPSQSLQTSGHVTANPDAYVDARMVETSMDQIRLSRARELEDAVRRGLIVKPGTPHKLTAALPFFGLQEDMCAPRERILRLRESAYKDWELDDSKSFLAKDRAVKSYHRSAAGGDDELPSDVRTPACLVRTIDYLLSHLVIQKSFPTVQEYLWDRTRAIRKDFSLQSFSTALTPDGLHAEIHSLEKCARFHLASLQLLKSTDRYATQMGNEIEQLQSTFISLNQAYARGRQHSLSCPHEGEFQALRLLFHSNELKPWKIDGLKHLETSQAFLLAKHLAGKVHLRRSKSSERDFSGVTALFKLLSSNEVPFTFVISMENHLDSLRQLYLTLLTPKLKGGQILAERLQNLLFLDNEQQAINFGVQLGFQIQSNLPPRRMKWTGPDLNKHTTRARSSSENIKLLEKSKVDSCVGSRTLLEFLNDLDRFGAHLIVSAEINDEVTSTFGFSPLLPLSSTQKLPTTRIPRPPVLLPAQLPSPQEDVPLAGVSVMPPFVVRSQKPRSSLFFDDSDLEDESMDDVLESAPVGTFGAQHISSTFRNVSSTVSANILPAAVPTSRRSHGIQATPKDGEATTSANGWVDRVSKGFKEQILFSGSRNRVSLPEKTSPPTSGAESPNQQGGQMDITIQPSLGLHSLLPRAVSMADSMNAAGSHDTTDMSSLGSVPILGAKVSAANCLTTDPGEPLIPECGVEIENIGSDARSNESDKSSEVWGTLAISASPTAIQVGKDDPWSGRSPRSGMRIQLKANWMPFPLGSSPTQEELAPYAPIDILSIFNSKANSYFKYNGDILFVVASAAQKPFWHRKLGMDTSPQRTGVQRNLSVSIVDAASEDISALNAAGVVYATSDVRSHPLSQQRRKIVKDLRRLKCILKDVQSNIWCTNLLLLSWTSLDSLEVSALVRKMRIIVPGKTAVYSILSASHSKDMIFEFRKFSSKIRPQQPLALSNKRLREDYEDFDQPGLAEDNIWSQYQPRKKPMRTAPLWDTSPRLQADTYAREAEVLVRPLEPRYNALVAKIRSFNRPISRLVQKLQGHDVYV